MNIVCPEIKAIEFFWPKMVKGGIVLLDDYEFPSHEEQQEAFDVFCKKHNTKVLPLPTGQGIIKKKVYIR